MLEVKNISFGYGDTPILKDVSFKVDDGEIVGLMAPSGYGKSTLAKIIAGYLKQDAGEILLDGKPYVYKKGFAPIQLAYQHPEKSVNPRFKVKDILNEGYLVSDEMKETFGIEDYWLEKWPVELSGGELQRVCLARLLRSDVKVLIADETTASLDAISQVEIMHALKKQTRSTNLSLIVISHDACLLEQVSDRILYLEEMNHIKTKAFTDL